MTEPGHDTDPAASLEREADQLEHHLEQLGYHISDAEKSAATIREQASPEKAAGDWEDTRGDPGQGEDPKGAVDEGDSGSGEAVGGPTPGDAAGGDD